MSKGLLNVVGVGLLGGSVALAARRTGRWRVCGYDADPAVLAYAVDHGLIHDAAPSLEAMDGFELLVIAVPVSKARQVLQRLAPRVPHSTSVTDTLSTKRSIAAAARDFLPRPANFIGAHPMAGGDRGGPAAARADLFDGANCYVLDGGDELARQKVLDFWQSLGCRTRPITADVHDKLVAAASHLPQVVASALAGCLSPDELAAGGNGLRDTTRIAASPAGLWVDILLDNREAVLAAMGGFADQLRGLRDAVAAGDADGLEALLSEAGVKRRALAPPETQHHDHAG